MRRMLELTLAGGKEVDLPYHSILMFEQMGPDSNPHFPTARSLVRYKIGDEVGFVILEDKVEDLVLELDINARADWIKLTKTGDDKFLFYLPADAIVSREQQENSCLLRVAVGDAIKMYEVAETRRQIKKWSERRDAPAPLPSAE